MSSLTPRPLCPGDFDKGYLTLVEQLSNYHMEMTRDSFDNMIGQPLYPHTVVIEDKGKIVACGSLLIIRKIHTRNIAQIEDVVVDKDYRGKGLGKAIINYLIEMTKRTLNCYKIILCCKDSNRTFYEKCGFKVEGLEMCIRS